ncbi:hypothetical protein FS837_009089 [Tulasnella sp. UAMH 9824]|nr:hypothetical protein FS837_009089 [Tulasnella sp. UAMH 9824]
MERYATRVQRSKSVQLDISINNEPFAESTTENIEAIMGLIGPHVERWRSLQIGEVPCPNIRVFLDQLKERSLPQLELLRIVELCSGYHRYHPPQSLGQLALDAPQLKEVELVGVVADFDCPLFHNLQALCLKDESFGNLRSTAVKDIIHKLLRQSPRLKRLDIRNPRRDLIFPPRERYSSPPSVYEELFSHASLVNLNLYLRREVYDTIISCTRFPALRSFHSAPRSGITLASWHLPLLVSNSPFPSLKRISLSADSSAPQHDCHLADALSTLVSLERLRLVRFNMALAANALPTLGHSCPQLGILSLYRCIGLEMNQVRSLVDRRLRDEGMTGLRELSVLGGIDDSVFPELKATETWLKERVESIVLFTDGKLA